MHKAAITGTGIFTPEEIITNAELVASYNEYAHRQNKLHADAIEAGEREPMPLSSEEFILKASGIERRHVMSKFGILDPGIMHPVLPERAEEDLSIMAEISVKAADEALTKAGLQAADIDAVICAASNHERAYPAIAIEVQQALGIKGFAFDMNVACSSATFGIQLAADMIRSGSARAVLMVNPEITSGHQEWRDRDCHFIFGDVCTAVIIQRAEDAETDDGFEILSTRLLTEFSNNIRNNNGFLRRTREGHMADRRDMQFHQEGRKVFKQVVPMVAELMLGHLTEAGLKPVQLSRLWLHQANKAMNDLIGQKVLGREPTREEQPNVLQDYANTSSAGSIIAFSKFSDDLPPGSYGVICSFGAGYSAGSVIVRKM
ncbi:beta-ketodecanoyl-[acyl-carrier-protein] synthase [Mesorhizobium albiziae]|uniref:Beta-ketodecanoyl-[acyl-carrier-protein] synthase n=1 Tax=Neomesorhizobium albiziae TaxID=335020 RepID=A0A1I3Y824_9HYPH|nr:beta-ketoacyl-ACP synthase III [Mesorhizobium albiziae]GLS30021.1 beta-ketoacyl-ACP synthase III [Mesorhizobium albiziae]SFK27975.1 beta-ketodecanoyl-[acyl-carrier-protein] synthase [Mesorhizobium albiziae]